MTRINLDGALQAWFITMNHMKETRASKIEWIRVFTHTQCSVFGRVFHTWERCANRKQAVAHENPKLRATFGVWKKVCKQSSQQCSRIQKRLLRYEWSSDQQSMRSAFLFWREYMSERRRLAEAQCRIMKRWRSSQLARPWSTWCKWNHEQKRWTRIAPRIVRRWSKCAMARAFASMTMQKDERQLLNQMAQAALRRWSARVLHVIWPAWCEYMSERRRLAAAQRRIMKRWRSSQLALPWSTWCKWNHEQKRWTRMEQVAETALRRWSARVLHVIWPAWCEYMSERRRLAAAQCRIMKRWRSSQLARPWSTWCKWNQEQKRWTRIAPRIVRRWSKCVLAMFIDTWKGTFASSHVKVRLMRRRRCRTALIHLREWRFVIYVDRARFLRIACMVFSSSYVARFRRNRLFEINMQLFRAWSRFVADHRSVSLVVNNTLKRMQGRVVQKGFDAFIMCSQDQQMVRVESEHRLAALNSRCLAQHFREWSVYVYCVYRIRKESQLAFERWAQQLYDVREQCRMVVHRLTNKLTIQDLAWGFHEWTEGVALRKSSRVQDQSAVTEMGGVQEANVDSTAFDFGDFATVTSDEPVAAVEEPASAIQEYCQSIIRHFALAVLRIAFHGWKDYVYKIVNARGSKSEESKTSVVAMLRAFQAKQCLAATMASWTQTAFDSVRLREDWDHNTTASSHQNLLSRTLRCWVLSHRKYMRRKIATDRIIDEALALNRNWNLLRVSGLFTSWVQETRSRNRHWMTSQVEEEDEDEFITPCYTPSEEAGEGEEEPADEVAFTGLVETSTDPDSWWSNMQRNMCIGDLRCSRDRKRDKVSKTEAMNRSVSWRTSRSKSLESHQFSWTSLPRGQLRFRGLPPNFEC